MMKKYWLLLEAYVFAWANENTALFYNSLSGKFVRIFQTEILKEIINSLLEENNLYCIEVTDVQLEHNEVREFVSTLRTMFMGDIYPQTKFTQKPLVVVPMESINEDKNYTIESTRNIAVFGQKIMNNLHTVSIRLTGICDNNCTYCSGLCKQFEWCNKNHHVLDFQTVDNILKQLENMHIPFVQFLGGDLLAYSYWEDLLSSLNSYSFNKCFYINCKNFFCESKVVQFFTNNELCHIRFLVEPSFKEADIVKCLALGMERVEYIFAITSEKEFEMANSVIDTYQLEASIYPFYNYTNLSFFENFVYQNMDDISNLHRSKKEIFANRQINSNFFGSLFIDSDQMVYANLNMPPIGKAGEKVSEWVFKEMREGKAWHLTRNDVSPCKGCLFRFLCPSPSNYELVIGRYNLCHIESC